MNKSTLAEETKKKKEQALRKKKEQALRKKKEQALRKKKEQALRKKKEQALRKKKEQALRKKKEQALRKKKEQALRKKKEQALRKKKEQALRKKMEDGYKDIKFNMDDETAFIILKSKCSFAYKDKFEDYGKISGSQCYKIMGKKRSIELKFRHDCFNYDDPCLDKEPSDILMIEVSFSMIKENSLKTLLNSLNQKYKLYKKVKIGKVFYKVFAEGNVVTKRVTGDMGTFLSLQFINPTFVSKYLEKLGFSEPELSSDDI
jgi:flagellar biosynthesis GTPase FlhF